MYTLSLPEEEVYYYIMTLQARGDKYDIAREGGDRPCVLLVINGILIGYFMELDIKILHR